MLIGGAWIVLGTGGGAILRLVSSMVLTRLLFPADFGLVATAGLLTTALEMFSDLGIRQALVQHPHGDSRSFLNTAFVMALCRGAALGLFMWILARPFASFFGDQRLCPILWVVAVSPVIRGLASPELLVYTRTLQFGRLERFELVCSALRIFATIALVLLWRSVWGLVIGGVVGEVVRTVGSFVITGFKPALSFNLVLARDIFRFGRFIMVSTILGYFSIQLDRAFVARYLGMELAGQYYIAVTLAAIVVGAVHRATGHALFSGLSRLQHDMERLNGEFQHAVRGVGRTIIPAMVLAAANSELLVIVLYDERYLAAGSVLVWLLAAGMARVWSDIFNAPLVATGHPLPGTVARAVSVLSVVVALPLMGGVWGMQGYAAGICISSVLGAAVTVAWVHRSGHAALRDWARSLGLAAALAGALLACHAVAATVFESAMERCIAVAAASMGIAGFWLWRHRAKCIHLVQTTLRPAKPVPAGASAAAQSR